MDRDKVREGMTVRSADGEKLGKVIGCTATTFVVEKGFFFPKERELAYNQVESAGEDELRLISGRSAYLEEAAPAQIRMPLSEEELVVGKRVQETGEIRVTKQVVSERQQVDVPVSREEVRVERVPASGARGEELAEGTIRVPVHEEEVVVAKRPVVKEEVRITKEVKQGVKKVDEEVRRETADIEDERRKGPGHPEP